MSLKDLKAEHIRLISRYSTRHAIRGGTGLVFLLLTLISGLLVAAIVLIPVDQMRQMNQGLEELTDQQIIDGFVRQAKPAVAWAVKDDHADYDIDAKYAAEEEARTWTNFLVYENPAVLSAILFILLMLVPLLTSIGGFNQLSGDVRNHGLRYQLLRTERVNIFFGRFIGTTFYIAITYGCLLTTIVLYLGVVLGFYEWGSLIAWALRGYSALVILAIPYIALALLISSLIDSPFGSLLLMLLIVAAVPIVGKLGGLFWPEAQYIYYFLPWGVKNNLLHYSAGPVLGAAAACMGYTAVFLSLGHLRFMKRDL